MIIVLILKNPCQPSSSRYTSLQEKHPNNDVIIPEPIPEPIFEPIVETQTLERTVTFELPQENPIQLALNSQYSSSDSEDSPSPPPRRPPPPPKKAPVKRQPKKWLERPPIKKPKYEKKKVVDLQETSDEEDEDDDSDAGSLEDFIVEEEEELENMDEIGEEDYPHLPQESQFPPDLPSPPEQSTEQSPEQPSPPEQPKSRPPPKATSIDDFLMLGALKVLSFGETLPYLSGITKKTYDSDMFHAAFAQCRQKWKVTYLKKLQPEYLLLLSVGFVVIDCVHENYVIPSGEKKKKEVAKKAAKKAAKEASKKATVETPT